MFISDFAIKRPIVTVTTMIAIVAFGIYALFKTDVDEFPDIQQPIVLVAVPYPGASPGQVEREVVDRMEEQFNAISGIDQITSTSTDGFAQIIVQYVFSKDPDQGAQDIPGRDLRDPGQAADGDERADHQAARSGELPIVSLALTSQTMSPSELTILADPGITKELRSITGVAQVTMSGGVDRTIAVNVRPADLQAAHVSVADVVNALNSQNLAAPVGAVVGTLTEQQIRLLGRLDTPQDFLQLVVAQPGRATRAARAGGRRQGHVGRSAFAWRCSTASSASASTSPSPRVSAPRGVADDIKRTDRRSAEDACRRACTLTLVRDAGVRVRNSVRNVEEALIEGALLTVLVVFLFLNSWRSTIITGLALPVSTIAAFIAVWACGFTLNTMSLLGLVAGDRHPDRRRDRGAREHRAPHRARRGSRRGVAYGTDEIGLAVTATTFSIVAVFVPVAFMNGSRGAVVQAIRADDRLRRARLALRVVLARSDAVGVLARSAARSASAAERARAGARPVQRVVRPAGRRVQERDRRGRSTIGRPWSPSRWSRSSAPSLLQNDIRRRGFIPDSDRSEFDIDVETPPGSNLDYMRLKLDELGRLVRVASLKWTTPTRPSATPLDRGGWTTRTFTCDSCPSRGRHVSQQVFAQTVRDEIARVGGVTPYVFSNGFGDRRKQIEVQLRGTDEAVLTRFAEQVLAQVRTVKGAADAGLSTKGQRPELQIDLNRGLAGTLGVSVGTVAQSLRPAFAGVHAGDWVDPTGKTRDVTVRLAPEARTNLADLAQLPLVLPGRRPWRIPPPRRRAWRRRGRISTHHHPTRPGRDHQHDPRTRARSTISTGTK